MKIDFNTYIESINKSLRMDRKNEGIEDTTFFVHKLTINKKIGSFKEYNLSIYICDLKTKESTRYVCINVVKDTKTVSEEFIYNEIASEAMIATTKVLSIHYKDFLYNKRNFWRQ